MIKIERGIPIPARIGRKGPRLYPWDGMTPGDSFFIEANPRKVRAAACQRAAKYGERYVVVTEGSGARCHRVEY